MKNLPNIHFLEALAQKAGSFLKANLSKLKKHQIHFKGQNDYVTAIDQACEKMLVEKIQKSFPSHQVMAEEFYASGPWDPDQPIWIIDPLDGTANFIHGLPIFSVSIGLFLKRKMLLGVVFDPNRNELFSAVRGRGAYLNRKKIRVSKTQRLKDGLLATGFPFRSNTIINDYLKTFKIFAKNSHGIRRTGSAAIDLCYVACGRYDGFWEFNLYPWDIAAGSLIVQEAGGITSDFQGQPLGLVPQNTLAGNPFTHPHLLSVVKKFFPNTRQE